MKGGEPLDQTIVTRHQAAKENRKPHDRNATLNLAFINDEQWVAWDKETSNLRLLLPDKQKPRLISNLIKPRLKQEYGELTALPPQFRVECNTQERSKRTYYYLKDLWDRYGYEKEGKDALLWADSTGTGYLKWYFDSGAGPLYGDVRAGDPIIVSRSHFNISLDPFAKSIDEASYLFDDTIRSREYVKKKYGVEVSGNGDFLYASLWQGRVKHQNKIPPVVVTEYWERPNAEYPEGRLVIFSGSTELYSGPNPYGEIPYAMIRHTVSAGEAYGDTWVSSARQVNVLYNRIRSDMLENSAKLGNPPLIAPMGAIQGDVEMGRGEIIKYNPLVAAGGKIDQLKIEPYPPQVVNTLLRLEQEMDELSGTSTKGGMPRGVRSAQQFSALRDKEELRRQTVMDEYRDAITAALNGVMRLGRRFSTLPRYVQAGNENLLIKPAEDIPPEALVKVKVELKPNVPPEEEQKMLFSLLDRKIIQDPRPVMRMTRFGSQEEVFTDVDLAASQQQREIRKLLQGESPPVEPWHNHPIHLVELNRFRMSEEYENLPDSVKAVFDQHGAMHQQFLAPKEGIANAPGNPGPGIPPGVPGA